uniref:Integrase catalytic domain-containing protein n=1 Tax=Tanacetum cinerariifolium TaxID=118510 RepID=A0A6L2KQ44_TANCI|nr:hypothetical protein [Tanacetum cinerariifolium]
MGYTSPISPNCTDANGHRFISGLRIEGVEAVMVCLARTWLGLLVEEEGKSGSVASRHKMVLYVSSNLLEFYQGSMGLLLKLEILYIPNNAFIFLPDSIFTAVQLPQRFNLTYIAEDESKRERPIMIHRAILGSLNGCLPSFWNITRESGHFGLALIKPLFAPSPKSFKFTDKSIDVQAHTIWGMSCPSRLTNGNDITLSAYIEKILKRYCMENSKRGSIPMQEKLKLSKSQGASTPAEMKRMQNVPYASANPGDIHWTTVKNILKYLMNIKDMFLVYGGDLKRELRVSCYTDAGYLADADDLKSQTRYVFVLNGGAVDWKSAKQSIFATSSAETEYIAAFDASKEAVWVRKFISGLKGVWENVSMDFITGLQFSKGFTTILVAVDRFSKYAHFGALPTNFNGHKVAELFMEIMVKHHRIPKTIGSDRDSIFGSNFWKELFRLSGTQLNQSTAYHPQSDGQTEVVKRGLEQYLRAMVLPLSLIPYPLGASKVAAVDELLMERNEVTRPLKQNFGCQIANGGEGKSFYGPYEIVERIGKVAYHLALPITSKIHPVFHVSILKLFTGTSSKMNGKYERQVLVQWAGWSPEEAT